MGDPVLVAILDHIDHRIAALEKLRDEKIIELMAAHWDSSLYTKEDALEDEELRLICEWLEDSTVLRKKVIEGKTS